ncbi:hypothetical protein G6F22_019851 [Rhizopus arrhizus]|nr:hypothetical protein G6F22_019851 [Rhizopus arrhizus]
MRPAAFSARSRSAAPPSISTVTSPERIAAAAARTASADVWARAASLTNTGAGALSDRSVQAASAGRIRVAILPGARRATAMASAASEDTAAAVIVRLTQCDIGRATPSTSLVSGASYWT